LLATRRGAESVAMQDFTAAVERIVAGLEKRNRVMSEQERRTVAVHEMGHALVAIALPGTDPVHKISIIPRGIGALGYTLQRPTEDRYLARRGELENRLAVLFGGRAAEALVIGELSTGAADPWLLISAGLVKGRTLTSWPTLEADIRNAQGSWLDQPVVVDRNWVSSRKPADIPAFNREFKRMLAERTRESVAGSADDAASAGGTGG